MSINGFLRFVEPALMLGVAGLFPGLLAPRSSAADLPPASLKSFQPANNEFAAMSNAVIALLQARDAARFAKETAESAEDWKAIAGTNLPGIGEILKSLANDADRQRQQTEAGAKAFLGKADSLHLDFSKGDLRARVVSPESFGYARYPSLQAEGETMPYAEKLEIVLNPVAGTNSMASGEFKIALHKLIRFPNGWRCDGGIQWEAFPSNVVGEEMARNMVILEKAANHKGITDEDDPALLRLGRTLVRFVREWDANVYAKDALLTTDFAWAMIQKSGREGASREALDGEVNKRNQQQIETARTMISQSEAAGIDLKEADIQIQEVAVGRIEPNGAPDSVDPLLGERFTLKMAVKSGGKAKTGTSLSGDYILTINHVMRFADDWKAMDNIHWYRVPAGVLDEKTAAAMEVENYVAEHQILPPGMVAPEIEFTTLDGGKKMKLSDLRGKVVVLDFWATWCPPCQAPMAELQKLRQAYPGWGDKAAIVPLSIDDDMDIVQQHVNKRGWTNTLNVWAGSGRWQCAPVQAFRVTSVPTTYIIDAQGKVVLAGHPAALPIGEKVDALIKGIKD